MSAAEQPSRTCEARREAVVILKIAAHAGKGARVLFVAVLQVAVARRARAVAKSSWDATGAASRSR